ncbi:MAG: domain protein putative component of TonB system [Labilithrix sp.]|nr:domain protein putative component of TonB system [Labilithrix sp.]
MNEATFEQSHGFEQGEVTGNVRLGRLEAMYEELYAEVIDDGVITQDERNQLDNMADSLGLDRGRLRRLEQALQAAYEARNRIVIKDLSMDDAPPPATIMPLEPATDHRTLALERRIKFLEGRIRELERDLEEARSQVSVEVDFSDAGPGGGTTRDLPEEDPAELARRVRADPRDDGTLHALFRLYKKSGDLDRQWCVAQVLAYLGAADGEEQELYARHREAALIRPTASVTQEAWRRLVSHPEEEPLIGEIFGVVVSAVLIGRLSALRRDKQLVKLDPAKAQDPVKSTIQAVRCFHWAEQILGMRSPPLHADPDYPGFVEMVPGVPPSSRIGGAALSGRSAAELAFVAGRHLACYREEHFVKMLVPQARGLEDIFLAALSIGNPGLPLSAQVKALVVPIANAIEPILEPAAIDRLRGHFLRFVEEGGRTNLARWAIAVDRSNARAGLLLANDLKAAHAVTALEDATHLNEKMDDLMSFVVSDRYSKLRKQIGIALPGVLS